MTKPRRDPGYSPLPGSEPYVAPVGLAWIMERSVEDENGCWRWTNYIGPNGYGRATVFPNGVKQVPLAHRLSWEIVYGRIPDGLQVDHLCRNRACVNPRHLDVVTPWENSWRSPIHRIKWLATECRQGHPWTEENTYHAKGKDGGRRCRACHREQERRRRERAA